MYESLISIDLKDAEPERRESFQEILKEAFWEKIENVENAWQYVFQGSIESGKAVSYLRKDIRDAMRKSGIENLTFAISLGGEKPVTEQIESFHLFRYLKRKFSLFLK